MDEVKDGTLVARAFQPAKHTCIHRCLPTHRRLTALNRGRASRLGRRGIAGTEAGEKTDGKVEREDIIGKGLYRTVHVY